MKKIANRTLSTDMYFDEQKKHLIAQGRLVDDRDVSFLPYQSEVADPGIFHSIGAVLTVDLETFAIQEISVSFQIYPAENCGNIAPVYESLIGLTITSGFTRKVLELTGGEKGCAHLTHLIISMGPAIIQGAYTALSHLSFTGEREEGVAEEQMGQFFNGTCHVWPVS